MANHDEKRSRDIRNLTGGGETVVWTVLEDWTVPSFIKARCEHGANWIGGNFFQKDAGTGMVIALVASPSAPEAEYEIAGRRLMEAAIAAHKQRLHVGYIAELNTRRHVNPESLTTQEMRDLLIDEGKDPDEILRKAREKREAEERAAADAAGEVPADENPDDVNPEPGEESGDEPQER